MKRKKKNKENKETTIENYYDLKTDKVDELVAALKGELNEEEAEPVSTNIEEITGEAPKAKPGSKRAFFDPYGHGFFARIPVWIKAFFIKFWFAGCVCYFVLMGLGIYISDELDKLVLAGVVLGVVTDIMVNPIFVFLETDKKEYNDYMMFPFPFKAFWTFFTNIIYYIIVALVVLGMYTGLNLLVNSITGVPEHYVSVGVEPLLYGAFCVIADMAFIGIKDLIVHLVKRAKEKRALKKALEAEMLDSAVNAEFGLDQQSGGAESEGADNQRTDTSSGGDGEEVDEVERLRRLAEQSNESLESNGKKKNKKK
ncbi:MAG: hypothetical protein ACI4QN_02070 [Candidatus Coproplasma sp.]